MTKALVRSAGGLFSLEEVYEIGLGSKGNILLCSMFTAAVCQHSRYR